MMLPSKEYLFSFRCVTPLYYCIVAQLCVLKTNYKISEMKYKLHRWWL